MKRLVHQTRFQISENRLARLHIIEAIEGGVLMTDIVSYQPPFGFLGSIANSVLIKKHLRKIFDYRKKAIEEMFGKME